jgi:hypothetical protein
MVLNRRLQWDSDDIMSMDYCLTTTGSGTARYPMPHQGLVTLPNVLFDHVAYFGSAKFKRGRSRLAGAPPPRGNGPLPAALGKLYFHVAVFRAIFAVFAGLFAF